MFENGNTIISNQIPKLDETQEISVVLNLQDTDTGGVEIINVQLGGTYIHNKKFMPGGGKQDLDFTLPLLIISTNRTKAEDKAEQAEADKERADEEKELAEADKDICLNDKSKLETKVSELEYNNTQLGIALGEKSCKFEDYKFLVLIIGILLFFTIRFKIQRDNAY